MEHIEIARQIVSRETFSLVDERVEEHHASLERYLDRLLWWNRKINLVSRDVPRETIWEHLRHSMVLAAFESYHEAELIVDAGTGGGLPGIPLAIADPGKRFLLNDIVTKKCMAVRQMARTLELENVRVVDAPVEQVDVPTSFLLVSKHAFKIGDLWKMVRGKPWDRMVFFKGMEFEKELEGIDLPVQIEAHDLSEGGEFYHGKALLFVRKI